MAERRILVVRLSSLGDIVHTLPAVHALRTAFPEARLDWLVDVHWAPLVEGNSDVSKVLRFVGDSWRGLWSSVSRLRERRYDAAIDFQGLYKSAVLARLAGARERTGFSRSVAREGGAAFFYTRRVTPTARHIIEQNLELAAAAGARPTGYRFPLRVAPEAEDYVRRQLAARGVTDYFVLCPGGGWRSKCWPAERYGHLHRRLMALPALAGWRGVINFGPGERALAEAARLVAGEPEPVLLPLELLQLVALVRGAKFLVGGDSGPLHLAVALGVPVVGLYGPTDPARNGPFSPDDIVVRNARPEETTYKRGGDYAPSMLSITVDQVVEAVQRRLGLGR